MKKIILALTCTLICLLNVSVCNAFPTLFKPKEKVITTEGYRQMMEERNNKNGELNRLMRYGAVVGEDTSGMVTICDPITKRNTQIHRSFLRLRK